MPRVIVTRALSDRFTGGITEFEVEASTIRQVIRTLDGRFPGIARHLEEGVTVAIDGEIYHDALLEPVSPDSEIVFLPMIEGG